MIAVTAAGGVVYRKRETGPEVLLIYRNGVWDLPKGKLEEGETVEVCARREVAEETGIPLPNIEGELTQTVHTYRRNGKAYKKTTFWFKMRTEEQGSFTPQIQEGIERVEWVPLEQAKQKVGYPNLESVIATFEDTL